MENVDSKMKHAFGQMNLGTEKFDKTFDSNVEKTHGLQ